MDATLGLLDKIAQSTAIPLFTLSLMLRCIQGPSKLPPRVESPIAKLISLDDAFELETAPIWDTQLPLLQLIQSTPFPGIKLCELDAFFRRYQASFPEIFEGSDLSDWVTLFEAMDLIMVYSGRVLLSITGKGFMCNRITNVRTCICG